MKEVTGVLAISSREVEIISGKITVHKIGFTYDEQGYMVEFYRRVLTGTAYIYYDSYIPNNEIENAIINWLNGI